MDASSRHSARELAMGRNRAAMPQLIDTYAFEERAAIREFDGGYGRAKAEWLARQDVACHQTNQEGPTPSIVRGAATPSRPTGRSVA